MRFPANTCFMAKYGEATVDPGPRLAAVFWPPENDRLRFAYSRGQNINVIRFQIDEVDDEAGQVFLRPGNGTGSVKLSFGNTMKEPATLEIYQRRHPSLATLGPHFRRTRSHYSVMQDGRLVLVLPPLKDRRPPRVREHEEMPVLPGLGI